MLDKIKRQMAKTTTSKMATRMTEMCFMESQTLVDSRASIRHLLPRLKKRKTQLPKN